MKIISLLNILYMYLIMDSRAQSIPSLYLVVETRA
jgi:hypothetical protein